MKKTKNLAFLLSGIAWVDPEVDVVISGIRVDSRAVKKGDLFIAYPGHQTDGRAFIQKAIQAGAAAILAEDGDYAWPLTTPVILLKTKNLQHKIGQIAARFYDYPSRHLYVTGVTGTNGKTSIAYLLSAAFSQLEEKENSVYLGTLGLGLPQCLKESTHTTLDPIGLQKCLADFLKQGMDYATLEVSSHALDQGRVAHVEFQNAVFTNLTRDHLDYHGTMEAYGKAKAKLFHQFGLKSAIINWDDTFGFELYESLPDAIFRIGYSLNNPEADIYAHTIRAHREGMEAQIETPWGEGMLKTPLMGRFNLYNILAVVGVLGLSYPLPKILRCIEKLPHVPGRMECLSAKEQPLFIVDYAHTPDALKNVLATAREFTEGKLWCIFGCGGDRDRGKRPEMGSIAEQLADYIIVTNDNPRTESPTQIADEITQGIQNKKHLTVMLDREEAIRHVFSQAKKEDVILIAGKGHENYQILGQEKHFFSDQAICQQLLQDN